MVPMSLSRRALLVALGVELVGIGLLVLSPSSATPDRVTLAVHDLLLHLWFPGRLATVGVVEFALNVALFAPLGATVALLAPRMRWWHLGGLFVALSGVLETTQMLSLSARDPSLTDVVANTLGGAVGSIAVVAACRLRDGVPDPGGATSDAAG
jgi:VanZ family protein